VFSIYCFEEKIGEVVFAPFVSTARTAVDEAMIDSIRKMDATATNKQRAILLA
jgi:hypothetical protein